MSEAAHTENLLFKLEEKMMTLLSEVETQRQDIARLQTENASLKSDNAVLRAERENFTAKLQDLVSLLDAVNAIEGVKIESKPAANMVVEELMA